MSELIADPDLAAALDRKVAAEAKIAARKAAAAPARAKREALDAAALAEAIAEHGDVGDALGTVNTEAGRVIVKRPTSTRWKRAQADMKPRHNSAPHDEELRLEEVGKTLIVDHLVHPERDRYFEIVGTYPALAPELLTMIGNLARGGAKALSGE